MRWFSCFHTSLLLAPPSKKIPKQTKNLALTHNAMQFQRWRFSRRFRCATRVAAPVASSLEQKMKRSGKAHFLRKLHLLMVVFYARSLQTQRMPIQVTSLGGNSLNSAPPPLESLLDTFYICWWTPPNTHSLAKLWLCCTGACSDVLRLKSEQEAFAVALWSGVEAGPTV